MTNIPNSKTHLKEGDKAPDFAIEDQNGKVVTLSELKGKKVILFFYPQDNTPTCTVEACNLRDNYSVLKKEGFLVYGISPDSHRKHKNFIKKFNLPFDLLVDKDLTLIKKYGVWGPKFFMGKHYDGLLRTTFVINEEGVIERVISKVVAKDHAQQILDTYTT